MSAKHLTKLFNFILIAALMLSWLPVSGASASAPAAGPRFSPSNAPAASGEIWGTLGTNDSGTNGTVNSIAVHGTDIYIGGSFTSITNCTGCAYIAKWNGTNWSALGGGTDGEVKSIVVASDGTVYAGGIFANAGGTQVNKIAKWKGTSWSALGYGLFGNVNAVALGSDGKIYAGGSFSKICGDATCTVVGATQDASHFTWWDPTAEVGGSWQVVSLASMSGSNAVYSLTVAGTDVYLGGSFGSITGCANCKYIGRWDGTNYNALGNGTQTGVVYSIAVDGSNVYVGGNFSKTTQSDSTTCDGCVMIAKWNGTTWSGLGMGLYQGLVNSIIISGGDLYVGGTFQSAYMDLSTSVSTNRVAKWSGGTWLALGSGLGKDVKSVALNSSGEVIAGGLFSSTDSNPNHIARYAASNSSSSSSSSSSSNSAVEVTNTEPADGGTVAAETSTLSVQFSTDVVSVSDSDPHSATNTANYLLVNRGANGVFDTSTSSNNAICLTNPHVPDGDDVNIPIDSISYNATSWTATLTIDPAFAPLVSGQYRLFVCGAASIHDLLGNAINGGTNVAVSFSVAAAGSGASGSSAAGSKDPKKLPDTGFAPNRISSLPAQPASLAYTRMSGLWLEIPSQKIQAEIVGVPKVDNNWDVSWLGSDAGWLNGTAFPTWNGNSVLTAHVTDANGRPGPFAYLENLAYGNKIVVLLYGEKYTYEVRQSRMVFPDTTLYAFEHLPDHSYLTLITCQGYNFLTDSYMFRRVVRAVLVSATAE